MMWNSTVVPLRQPETIDDPLTAVLRSGARRLLAQAIEAEAEVNRTGFPGGDFAWVRRRWPDLSHQPGGRAARHRDPFPAELPPDLAHAVDPEIPLPDPTDFGSQDRVPPPSGRQARGVAPPGGMLVESRRSDRHHMADRLDPIDRAVFVDEGDHGFERRSSSAIAK